MTKIVKLDLGQLAQASQALDRMQIALEAYEHCLHLTESFERDDLIGPDLAYLLGGILTGNGCAWPAERPIMLVLRERFPPSHALWLYIEIDEEA